MPRRREISCDPTESVFCEPELGAPSDPLVALMEAAPGDPIPTSQAELLPLRDVLQDAMDRVLEPRERWVFDAIVVERKSIRAVGRELNLAKSYVHRIYHEAVRKLREELVATEPIIQAYLHRGDV